MFRRFPAGSMSVRFEHPYEVQKWRSRANSRCISVMSPQICRYVRSLSCSGAIERQSVTPATRSKIDVTARPSTSRLNFWRMSFADESAISSKKRRGRSRRWNENAFDSSANEGVSRRARSSEFARPSTQGRSIFVASDASTAQAERARRLHRRPEFLQGSYPNRARAARRRAL